MNTSHALSTHQLTPPDFSIITIHDGSGDASDLLACCVASLADQEGTKSEHVLQHLGGANNLWNKLSKELNLSKRAQRYTLRLLEEKNSNFYEALSRATTRTAGTFVGFLQPKEQFLPGALIAVEKYFNAHPETDLLFTGALQHHEGKITPRPALPLSLEYLWTAYPSILSSTLFFRAALLKKDFPLNPAYQHLMLEEWLLRVLQAGKKVDLLSIATTLSPAASSQKNDQEIPLLPSAPALMKLLTPWWQLRHSCAAKKAKRQFPAATPCMAYQLNSLTERRKI